MRPSGQNKHIHWLKYDIMHHAITLKKYLNTAKACFHRTLIAHIFSIQNRYTIKHIGLDLSGVIKHIDAPDWTSMSKNYH